MTKPSQVKERPILYSAPMVREVLEDRKTQTRRVVKSFKHLVPALGEERDCIKDLDGLPSRLDMAPSNWECCPYGGPGDRLWVREAVWLPRTTTANDLREGADTWPKCIYSADTDAAEIEWMREHRWKQRPSNVYPGQRIRPWVPSLDRLIAGTGYVDGNVRIVCAAVNLALNQFGDEIFFRMVSGAMNNRSKLRTRGKSADQNRDAEIL